MPNPLRTEAERIADLSSKTAGKLMTLIAFKKDTATVEEFCDIITDALLRVQQAQRDIIERQREAIKSALMFLYDSEQGINGVEESANKTIDTLEAALAQGEAGRTA